jgi:RNA polymerase sigma-70 factor (ECF subfamily)
MESTNPAFLAAVIDRVKRGDRDEFHVLVRAFHLRLRTYVATYVFHSDDVDDITQDVLLAAYRKLPDLPEGDDFGVWLRGIAKNKILHHRRSEARQARVMDGFKENLLHELEDRLEVIDSEAQSEHLDRLLWCITRLPDRLRRVVRAGLGGTKPAALAGEMGVTVMAVYQLHSRANRLLRECMKGTPK